MDCVTHVLLKNEDIGKELYMKESDFEVLGYNEVGAIDFDVDLFGNDLDNSDETTFLG